MTGYSSVFCIILLLALVTQAHSAACATNWFGKNCSFFCHCDSLPCRPDGNCERSDECKVGWFHDACQYSDLLYSNADNLTDSVLSDFNDYTCLKANQSVFETRVGFVNYVRFFWIRLVLNVKAGDTGTGLYPVFNNNQIPCRNGRRFVINPRVIDFECDLQEPVNSIVIIGAGASYLCSVYVSRGQNLALQQGTTLSSVGVDVLGVPFPSSLAVDGNILVHDRCSRTDVKDTYNQTFQLTFKMPVFLHYIVVYSGFRFRENLANFLLVTVDESNKLIESYRNNVGTAYASKYTITLTETSKMVKSIFIMINASKGVLEICEMEAFGIPVCADGQVDYACSTSCSCPNNVCAAHNTSCLFSCVVGYYGPSCSQPCPENCYPLGSCDTVTGYCSSCSAGYSGSKCDQACPTSTYGIGCSNSCSLACTDSACNPITGYCRSCNKGLYGPTCEEQCPEHCLNGVCNETGQCPQCIRGFYGDMCLVYCSPACYDNICNNTNGYCFSCMDGYYGTVCSTMCPTRCRDNLCDFANGDCFECDPGYYSRSCFVPCPGNCLHGVCDIDNGTCSDGCLVGYFGSGCTNSCSLICKDKQCNQRTGVCIACDNAYGTDCSIECPQVCANRTCDRYTGNCIVCEKGFYGDHCTKICPDNCANKECDINNGSCNSCVSGFYGISCTKPCPAHCMNTECVMNTGACVKAKASVKESTSYMYVIIGLVASLTVVALLLLYKKRHPPTSTKEEAEGADDVDSSESYLSETEQNTIG